MAEISGKLDGLRDIMAPAIPLTPDQFPWFLVIAAIGLCVTVAVTVWRYRRQPQYMARRLFRQLYRDWPACKPSVCGHRLVEILRLYSGQHDLRKAIPDNADWQAWVTLLEDCDRLRFSTIENAEALIEAIMDRTRTLIGSRT